jgi:hypothetical protein
MGRFLIAWTSLSSVRQLRETSDLEIPSIPQGPDQVIDLSRRDALDVGPW